MASGAAPVIFCCLPAHSRCFWNSVSEMSPFLIAPKPTPGLRGHLPRFARSGVSWSGIPIAERAVETAAPFRPECAELPELAGLVENLLRCVERRACTALNCSTTAVIAWVTPVMPWVPAANVSICLASP